MIYELVFSKVADVDLRRLKRNEPQAYKKAVKLLEELQEHPQTGTGKPEQLKGDRAGQWSRRITDRHRLVYEIEEEQVMVLILSSYGHYDDK